MAEETYESRLHFTLMKQSINEGNTRFLKFARASNPKKNYNVGDVVRVIPTDGGVLDTGSVLELEITKATKYKEETVSKTLEAMFKAEGFDCLPGITNVSVAEIYYERVHDMIRENGIVMYEGRKYVKPQ